MSRHNLALGLYGERVAKEYLKRNGYKILEANFRSPLGQIDIVAKDRDAIVFIEVKTRSSESFGLPEEAIDLRKRRKLLSVGWFFIKKYNLKNCNFRFDIVSILKKENAAQRINLIKNAFEE